MPSSGITTYSLQKYSRFSNDKTVIGNITFQSSLNSAEIAQLALNHSVIYGELKPFMVVDFKPIGTFLLHWFDYGNTAVLRSLNGFGLIYFVLFSLLTHSKRSSITKCQKNSKTILLALTLAPGKNN
jgi:hypothetical protein